VGRHGDGGFLEIEQNGARDFPRPHFHGADGTRTRGLRAASATLSQLSYGPVVSAKCSAELVLLSPIDASPLIITRRGKPKHDEGAISEVIDRKEATLRYLGAVGRDRVDVVGRVPAPNETVWATAGRPTRDDDDFAILRSPLALDTNESLSQVENEVIALVTERSRYADS
jgi:hypothetical protein